MDAPTSLERKAQLLAQKMVDATGRLARALGAGERPAFTEALTRSESLEWWRAHRHDEWGKQALERLQPWDIARLDAALGGYVEQQQQANAYGGPGMTGGAGLG